MVYYRKFLLFVSLVAALGLVHAQSAVQTAGALVIVPAYGEVTHGNDEVRISFMIEEQDKDKSVAASRVNLKMKQGTDLIKREDPRAILKTHGYYTYPVYPEDQLRQNTRARQPVSWRVGQYLEVKTTNLSGLPKTVATVQQILALNGLQFGLSDATTRKLDGQRIEAAYRHLNERVAAIAKAMGRNLSDAVIDTIDFEASGAYAPQGDATMKTVGMAAVREAQQVEEPSFEPGETTLQMRVVGKVKFK